MAAINPYTPTPERIAFEAVYLNVNTQSSAANAQFGLKLNHRFTVAGVFGLDASNFNNVRSEGFGIRLADFYSLGGGNASDIIDLLAYKSDAGHLRAAFYHQNYASGVVELINEITLDPTRGNQVEFMLSKPTADDPTIEASLRYVDQGSPGASWTSLGSTTGFHGEIFTTPGFFAGAAPVPEPATWALWAAGLGLLGVCAPRRWSQRAQRTR